VHISETSILEWKKERREKKRKKQRCKQSPVPPCCGEVLWANFFDMCERLRYCAPAEASSNKILIVTTTTIIFSIVLLPIVTHLNCLVIGQHRPVRVVRARAIFESELHRLYTTTPPAGNADHNDDTLVSPHIRRRGTPTPQFTGSIDVILSKRQLQRQRG
jgi:hypothetical protein